MTSALKKLQQHNMFCILKAEKNMEALISHVWNIDSSIFLWYQLQFDLFSQIQKLFVSFLWNFISFLLVINYLVMTGEH